MGCRHGADWDVGGPRCSRGEGRRGNRRLAVGELAMQRMGGQTEQAAEFCAALPGPVRVAYEVGPTGFGLARALAGGIQCTVAAPGKIERPAQDRVKTDRRDAERLARLLMIGGLHPVRVPTPAEEAMRDLVRAREDVRGDLMRARHPWPSRSARRGRLDRCAISWKAQQRLHRSWVRLDSERGKRRTLCAVAGPAVANPRISA